MMQGILDNPEIMQQMMMANPMMQRLAEANPQMAQMLQDPEFIRQSLRMIQNPGLMNEMMRGNDVVGSFFP